MIRKIISFFFSKSSSRVLNKRVRTTALCALVGVLASVPVMVGYYQNSAFAANTLTLFEEVWTSFDQNYSYFTYKNIDWDQVKTDYQSNFDQELSATDFAYEINDMLQVLHDWHVWVGLPDGTYIGYNGSYDKNYPPTLFTKYTKDGSYQKLGDNVIYHAIVDQNIAHIVIDTLDSNSFSSISDSDIENLFDTYKNTDGIIIDIRANSGGNEDNAAKFASHFTDSSRVYGYVKYRTPGSNHDDFGNLISKTLQPSTGTYFSNPVVCLIGQRCMSSAEWFTLMMRDCPNVTLIGDRTRGASGNPQEFSLSNNVSYSVSTWIAYSDQRVEIEDRGIEPAIKIAASASFDSENDYVLEKAISFINEGAPPTTTTSSNGASTTTTTTEGGTHLIADPGSGPAPLTVTFTCITDLPVAHYSWDFEDDSPEETTTLGTTIHTYTTPGTYLAFVSLLDSEGFLIDLASATIEVSSNGTSTTTISVCPSEQIYGEYSEETELLRALRDNVLSKSQEGRELIRLYCTWGPAIVKAMEEDKEFKEAVKEMADGVLLLIGGGVE